MTPDRRPTPACSLPAVPVPPVLAAWLVLVTGAILAPGQRTVSAALRVMGLADRPGFGRYHEVLSEARWDARALARKLLLHLLEVLLPEGQLVIVPDDSIERRWGPTSATAASIAIRCAPRAASSSKPAACAGCRWRWCCRSHGRSAAGRSWKVPPA
ncbi:transposase [Rhodopila globiformis]|uniref:transposase n=1 Tax=Rhodopila globiformis TaxID=1071 RepID=UPI000CEC8837